MPIARELQPKMRGCVSIIIPVLNEEATLRQALPALYLMRNSGVELIAVDGGSQDRTKEVAAAYCDVVLTSEQGRALQMNTGGRFASGDILLFLHADTLLPDNFLDALDHLRADAGQWGRFDVRLNGKRRLYRVISFFISARSRLTSIATGDQAIFMKRSFFTRVGGFPSMPLMEDVSFSVKARRESKPVCSPLKVVTSSRRWDRHGAWTTIFLMWKLRLLFAVGVSPEKLHKQYYG